MKRKETLIVGAVGVVLAILMVLVLIKPKANAVHTKQAEVVTAQAQQESLLTTLAQLKADEKDAPADRKLLAGLRAKIPPTADLPGLIRLLNKAADQANVDFLTITPGTPTTSADGQVSIIPVQLMVTGGFFSIDQYLFQLESLPRISTVENVSLNGGASGTTTTGLQASLTVNFYTTDLAAGPGSNPAPGSTIGSSASPTPSANPSPSTGG
jgi:Tfp pilus assembly protein PilO